VELVGGAHDGGLVSPGFSLDLERVRAAFERVEDLNWNAHCVGPGDEGPCISVEGQFAGHEVWLRVLAYAPDDEEPGMIGDNYFSPSATIRIPHAALR
jgi:hypothetical protein